MQWSLYFKVRPAYSKYLWVALFFLSCHSNKTNQVLQGSLNKDKARESIGKLQVKPVRTEFFVDSETVGRKKLNMVEIARYEVTDRSYVVIKFYSKQNNKWIIKNTFHLPKDGFIGCDPEISDFNNDGLNDVTYVSSVAGRLANEIRTLLIYDKGNDKLIHIRNSTDFPNMLYNKELNCIDAFLLSGCNTTVFLKIEADSLREFASVDQCDSLTVSTYNKKGVEKVILKKKTDKYDFTRFKNYNPLEEYD